MRRTTERVVPRISFRMPVEVRRQGQFRGLTVTCMSENLSANGISFVTRLPLTVGHLIDMVFVMPRELTERLITPFQYTGRILRVHRIDGPEEKYQVAANLLWLSNIGPRMSDLDSDKRDCQSAA